MENTCGVHLIKRCVGSVIFWFQKLWFLPSYCFRNIIPMDKSNYDKLYLILCQLLRVLRYSTGMIVLYFVTRSVKNLQHWKSCSETKHTSVHILKSPCFETKTGKRFQELQMLDILKHLFNEEKLEKYAKITHLYRYWLKVSFN